MSAVTEVNRSTNKGERRNSAASLVKCGCMRTKENETLREDKRSEQGTRVSLSVCLIMTFTGQLMICLNWKNSLGAMSPDWPSQEASNILTHNLYTGHIKVGKSH